MNVCICNKAERVAAEQVSPVPGCRGRKGTQSCGPTKPRSQFCVAPGSQRRLSLLSLQGFRSCLGAEGERGHS